MSGAAYLGRLFGVSGQTVLVTGGTRGIGLAIAEGFVRSGADVVVTSRKQDACDETLRLLEPLGSCRAFTADISTTRGRACLVESLADAPLHTLINNAGTTWAASYASYPEDAWDKVLALNTKAPFFLTRDLTPVLSRTATAEQPARVINVGSINAIRVPPHETFAYTASKAALHHLTRHLAKHLAPLHINVNTIAPGLFPSKMLEATLAKKGADVVLADVPLGRLASPDDVAAAAIYLASPGGSYITGAVISVDGGTAMSPVGS